MCKTKRFFTSWGWELWCGVVLVAGNARGNDGSGGGVLLEDCNGNLIVDSVDLTLGTSKDCNGNRAPDECDIRSDGMSLDTNLNRVPDECETRFRRANSNCDAEVDISDAVFTLNFLFQGGDSPCCIDAADSSNQGEVNISSAVYLLSFLFFGGLAPPPPFPGCGLDPADGPGASPCDSPQATCQES